MPEAARTMHRTSGGTQKVRKLIGLWNCSICCARRTSGKHATRVRWRAGSSSGQRCTSPEAINGMPEAARTMHRTQRVQRKARSACSGCGTAPPAAHGGLQANMRRGFVGEREAAAGSAAHRLKLSMGCPKPLGMCIARSEDAESS